MLINNKEWGLVFELLALEGGIKGVLTALTVAMVTSDVMELTTTCSAMIGHLIDIIIVAATDKDLWY